MGRAATTSRPVATATISVDVVVLGCRDRRLHAFAEGTRSRLTLPWGAPATGESLEVVAARIARGALGTIPRWLEQVGAFTDGANHPGGAAVSVCFVGALAADESAAWRRADRLSSLPDRQRRMLRAAQDAVRSRLEQAPLAFSMLPREFTLSELQLTYETILARPLHKASFRRALHAAVVVEPTGQWRSEGRGRPAQLYRYAPRRRRGLRRGIRLDLL